MQSWAWDDVNDYAANYLNGVTSEQKTDLENLINDWAVRNNIKPDFYEVEDIEVIELSRKEFFNLIGEEDE